MVYLCGLINDTEKHEFRLIFRRATYLTFVISVVCAFWGETILFRLFQVELATMRIFGGMITLNLAFLYVMKGPSCTLRLIVCFGVRNRFLASCWVIVEPPWTTWPAWTLATMARASPSGSRPGW